MFREGRSSAWCHLSRCEGCFGAAWVAEVTSFALAVALSLSFQIAMMMWFFFCTHVEFSPYPGIMCCTLDVFGCAQSEGETGKLYICRFTFSKKQMHWAVCQKSLFRGVRLVWIQLALNLKFARLVELPVVQEPGRLAAVSDALGRRGYGLDTTAPESQVAGKQTPGICS